MDSGFVFSCCEVFIFSVERAGVLVSLLGVSQGLTVPLSQALWPCPAFALQEAGEQLLGGHQSICLDGGSPLLSGLLPLASAQAASDPWTLQAGLLPLECSWVARVKAVKSRKPGFCMKFQNVWF